jgi:hypothetical protein
MDNGFVDTRTVAQLIEDRALFDLAAVEPGELVRIRDEAGGTWFLVFLQGFQVQPQRIARVSITAKNRRLRTDSPLNTWVERVVRYYQPLNISSNGVRVTDHIPPVETMWVGGVKVIGT